MICPQCKLTRHESCRGGTWCDCQHRGPDGRPRVPSRPASTSSDHGSGNFLTNTVDAVVDFFT